jgi:glycine cleavage system aminomethyltransferase T
MGLGYVERLGAADALPVLSQEYEIEVACERVPARAFVRPPYDPGSERVRA